MDIADPCIPLCCQHEIADGVHQVSFAEADTAVDKKRVVRTPGIFANLTRGGSSKLVALAFDKVLERE